MARTRGFQTLARDQVAYDSFAKAVELPLTILALLWLPVLVLPYIINLAPDVREAFGAIDLFVWAMFVLEYLIKLYLSPSRRGFFIHHLLDLAVIAVPMFRPLRVCTTT